MTERNDWEANTYAGLEELDEAGSARVAGLGPQADETDDEPGVLSNGMPAFEEIEGLQDGARLA